MLISHDEILRVSKVTRDLIFPLAATALGVYLLIGTMLHHDVSWYLVSTRWWVDGLPIYDEILELNPPLAFYLTVPPVWAAREFDISPTTAFKVYTFALISISLLIMRQTMISSEDISDPMRRALLAIASIGLIVLPIRDFGQREHLFTIFFLPYLAMHLRLQPLGISSRAGIAAWATIGVALKHYFIVAPFLIFVYYIFKEKSLRPILRLEFSLPIGLLVGYVLAIFLLHPSYFDKIIPLTLQIYGAYTRDFFEILWRAVPALAVIWLTAGLSVMTRRKSPASTIVQLVALSGTAVFLLQSKGWGYHLVPAHAFAAFAVVWAGMELSNERRHWWPLVPSALAIAILLVPALIQGPYQNPLTKLAEKHFDCPPGQRTFQVFSSKVSASFPLANYAQAEPTNRAPALWLFPGAAYQLTQATDEIEQQKYNKILNQARDLVISDFMRVRPQLVFVDIRQNKVYFRGARFDYIEFFKENNVFAEEWVNYRHSGNLNNFAIYKRPGCAM